MSKKNQIEINGSDLTLCQIMDVAYNQTKVIINKQTIEKINRSVKYLAEALKRNKLIYGVNTNFGAMAKFKINKDDYQNLQAHLIFGLKCGIGRRLSNEQVRAAMLIRANSLVKGLSGIRYELINRLCLFLNANLIPIVYEHGSIGASGDLIPLAYIAGTITGLSTKFKVDSCGKEIDALTALKHLKLKSFNFAPKEGLALVNGTAIMNGIAAQCVHEARLLFELSLHIHCFFIQALGGILEPFDDFIHRNKPHPGQIYVSKKIRSLISIKRSFCNKSNHFTNTKELPQDRYSIRCLPQYLGAIIDGILSIESVIECEANSATDNPLIDADRDKILHGGNFLGQYIAVSMDQLRYYLALLIKHIDVQIALLVSPEFNNGLEGSLATENATSIKFGLKGLQLCANSIMPLILRQANNIATLYPTHAEQFNQNINSQGASSAYLTWETIQLTKQYLTIALIFAIQGVDLRCYKKHQNYNTQPYLSNRLNKIYDLIREITCQPKLHDKPYIYNLEEQVLDELMAKLFDDLNSSNSRLLNAIKI